MDSSSSKPGTVASPPLSSSELEEEPERNTNRGKRPEITIVPRSGTPTSSASAASPSPTINLSREYTLAIQTASYQEIWTKIHRVSDAEGDNEGPTIAHVLQPDRASVEEILRTAPDTRMTRLISNYLESSEQTSVVCLSLQGSVARARTLYDPIGELLDLIPISGTSTGMVVDLTPALCNKAFDVFVEFDEIENPFPSPSSSSADANGSSSTRTNSQFQGMKGSFLELKQQLDVKLHKARRKNRILRRTTRGSGICLIACTTGLTVVGLVLASHIMAALVAGSACILGGSCCDWVAMHGLKEDMDRLDAAARNTYALNNDLDTIERLVARVHETIEDDKKLMGLGIAGGRGQRHPIEHVLRYLRKNHSSLLQQLLELDEHICLYFASVNRVRSLLLQHIHQSQS
ncbi:hypothetical protein LUZ63_008484 [Rhynchospora breviuscula]|uniref:Uncharacterized protein n=1 Tax=Rhynchospora breviuscula TaxID=2022672 RepID=A0A9Q0HVF4_9POAL|nr:hypothetical protein LUZ63_008484 [Rhynchospora breviuscula]